MRLKEGSGRKVVSTENAESIGTVEAYVIDPRKRCITALRLGKVKGDATFVSWKDLEFGPDPSSLPHRTGCGHRKMTPKPAPGPRSCSPLASWCSTKGALRWAKWAMSSSIPRLEPSSKSTSETRGQSRVTC